MVVRTGTDRLKAERDISLSSETWPCQQVGLSSFLTDTTPGESRPLSQEKPWNARGPSRGQAQPMRMASAEDAQVGGMSLLLQSHRRVRHLLEIPISASWGLNGSEAYCKPRAYGTPATGFGSVFAGRQATVWIDIRRSWGSLASLAKAGWAMHS